MLDGYMQRICAHDHGHSWTEPLNIPLHLTFVSISFHFRTSCHHLNHLITWISIAGWASGTIGIYRDEGKQFGGREWKWVECVFFSFSSKLLPKLNLKPVMLGWSLPDEPVVGLATLASPCFVLTFASSHHSALNVCGLSMSGTRRCCRCCQHFFAGRYPFAVAEYSRAHRLAPFAVASVPHDLSAPRPQCPRWKWGFKSSQNLDLHWSPFHPTVDLRQFPYFPWQNNII